MKYMKNYTSDPNWFKEVRPGETWISKVPLNNYFNKIKIISVTNLKNKKCIKIEYLNGKRATIEPGFVFYNYKKC